MLEGNDSKPLRVLRRWHRRATTLGLNQNDLQGIPELRSGKGLTVIFAYRYQVNQAA
jgi:hypothetical protein